MMPGISERVHGRTRVRRALIITVIVLIPFALHAIWDQAEASLLARSVRDLQRRGEPINLRAVRAPLPTPEERKAARLYAAAADLASAVARDNPETRLPSASAVIESSLKLPDLNARLDELERRYSDGDTALQLLDQATPLKFGGFGDHAPDLRTNGSPLEELNSLNAIRSEIASARRQTDAAVSAIVTSVRLHRTMPTLFYQQLITDRTFEALRLLFITNVVPVSELNLLRQAYEGTPDEDGAAEDLRIGRARLIGDFWPYAPELTPWALRMKPPIRSGVMETFRFVALRPFITHQFRRMLQPIDEAIAVATLPWPEKLDAADALARKYSIDPQRRTFPKSFISQLGMFPRFLGPANLEWNLPRAGHVLARRRVALVALAVEQYRRDHAEALPPNLDALVPAYLGKVPMDPFNGHPIRFVPQRESYVVYSVDVDRKDDGGALYGAYTGRTSNVFDRGARDLGMRIPLTPATRGEQ
jgi:hypothetical protein